MKPQIIMFGHKAGSGKDTSCNILKSLGFIRYAFADKLKEMVSSLYGFNHDQMHGHLKEVQDARYPNLIDTGADKYMTPRRVLQIFGQQQRSIYPLIWPDYVFRMIELSVICGSGLFTISDFRFTNEYEYAAKWCQENNADLTMVRVDRDSGIVCEDISEHDLDDFSNWDYKVDNNSSMDNLVNTITYIGNSVLAQAK